MNKKLIVLGILMCALMVLGVVGVSAGITIPTKYTVAEASTAPGPVVDEGGNIGIDGSHSGPSNCFDKPPAGGGDCSVSPPYPNGRVFGTTYALSDGFHPAGGVLLYADNNITSAYCGIGAIELGVDVGILDTTTADVIIRVNPDDSVEVTSGGIPVLNVPAGAPRTEGVGIANGVPLTCEGGTASGTGFVRCGFGLNFDPAVHIYLWEIGTDEAIEVTASPNYLDRNELGFGKGVFVFDTDANTASMSFEGTTDNPTWWASNNGATVSVSAVPLLPRKITGTADIDVKELPTGDYMVKFLFGNIELRDATGSSHDPMDVIFNAPLSIDDVASIFLEEFDHAIDARFSGFGIADFAIGSMNDPYVMAHAAVDSVDFELAYSPFTQKFSINHGLIKLIVPGEEWGELGATTHWNDHEFTIGFPNSVNFPVGNTDAGDANGFEVDMTATLAVAVDGDGIEGRFDSSQYELGYGMWLDFGDGEYWWHWIDC